MSTAASSPMLAGFRVSVVIASYNQCDYLAETIESVIAQKFLPHEILVADDCSTDDSPALIHEYVRKYPNWIRSVLQKNNVRIPRNRNSALELATGNYVMIVDGDDRLLPDNLQTLAHAIAAAGPPAAAYSNLHYVDASGNRIGIRDSTPQPSGMIFTDILKGLFGILRSMMLPTEHARQLGFMDPEFPTYDGYVLTLGLSKLIPIVYVDSPVAEYRVHTASASNRTPYRDRIDHLQSVRRLVRREAAALQPLEIAAIEAAWDGIMQRMEAAARRDGSNAGDAEVSR